jgi:hypothetical protein
MCKGVSPLVQRAFFGRQSRFVEEFSSKVTAAFGALPLGLIGLVWRIGALELIASGANGDSALEFGVGDVDGLGFDGGGDQAGASGCGGFGKIRKAWWEQRGVEVLQRPIRIRITIRMQNLGKFLAHGGVLSIV